MWGSALMRQATQAAIDALHSQIDALVAAEKAHHDSQHPGEDGLFRQIAHTKIEHQARSIKDRGMMRWAAATFPVFKDHPK